MYIKSRIMRFRGNLVIPAHCCCRTIYTAYKTVTIWGTPIRVCCFKEIHIQDRSLLLVGQWCLFQLWVKFAVLWRLGVLIDLSFWGEVIYTSIIYTNSIQKRRKNGLSPYRIVNLIPIGLTISILQVRDGFFAFKPLKTGKSHICSPSRYCI